MLAFTIVPGISTPMLYLWAFSIAVQMVVFGLLCYHGYSRKLPLYTAYVLLNLLQGCLLWATYYLFGFYSHATFWIFWPSEALILFIQTFGLIEVFYVSLCRYSGIWALAWRLLLVTFTGVLVYAGIEAGVNLPWVIMIAHRGFYLAFVVTVVYLLLLVRYYTIPIDPVYKAIMGGFCFFAAIEVLTATIVQKLFLLRVPHYEDVANWTNILAYLGVQVVWVAVMSKPMQAHDEKLDLLPASAYQAMSPEINARLRLLNDRLSNFWKVGQPHS